MNNSSKWVSCVAAAVIAVLLPASSYAQHKTAKACESEWKANKAAIQGSGKTKKAFMVECRSGTGEQAAAGTTGNAAQNETSRPKRTARAETGAARSPKAAGEYATESEAKAHCPGQTVVWANTRSNIYHFSGTRAYGNTKQGAYVCENQAAALGLRSAKNEKRH